MPETQVGIGRGDGLMRSSEPIDEPQYHEDAAMICKASCGLQGILRLSRRFAICKLPDIYGNQERQE
jgi:hypothetical protein